MIAFDRECKFIELETQEQLVINAKIALCNQA
jgi:hypothetical protein